MSPQEGKERAKVEPRSCQKTRQHKARTTNQEEKEKKTKSRKERRKPAKNTPKETTSKRGRASGKPLFDTVMGGSDAESRVDRKSSGVPPWETQRECTNELIGSDLVEREKLGKHP